MWQVLRARRWIAAAALLLGTASPAAPRSRFPAGQELHSFLAEVQRALRYGRAAEVASRAQDPASFAWLSSVAARDLPKWTLGAVTVPGDSGPTHLAIFRTFHTLESTGDHIYRLVQSNGSWRFGQEIPEADTLGYRVRDHRLVVTFDLPNSACRITDDVRLERVRPDAGICILRLSSDMRVDRVTIGGQDAGAQAVPGMVVLPKRNEGTITVRLEYHGAVNHPGSDYIRADEVLLCSYWYPHIARLPATQTTTVTVPKGWTADAEGELVSRAEKRHSTTFTFANSIPTCFFSLDAGEYAITTRIVDGRKLSVYELDPKPGRAQRALDLLQRALAFFEANLGPFPYSHYELVETRGPFDGDLEAYSFSTYNRGDFGAVVHELSHTWWGGIVPNPYTQSLWNESFASYSDDLFQRMTGGHPSGRALTGAHGPPDYGRGLLQAFSVPLAQAYDTMDHTQAAVGYGKGAMVLQMLEDELGTPVMLRCLRRFIRAHPSGEAGSWEEFRNAVEAETGKNWEWFFRQWIYRPGVPVIAAAGGAVQREGAEYVVQWTVRQRGPAYRLHLPVVIRGAGGAMAQDTVAVQGEATVVRLKVPFRPVSVALDPDGSVLMAADPAAASGDDPFTLELPQAAAARLKRHARLSPMLQKG